MRLHYGNPFAPIQSLYAGVLWAKPVSSCAAGNFCAVSFGRALNRPRSPEVRKPLVYFWFFSYKRKARKTSPLQEASRFCKPRFSSPQWRLRTNKIKTFCRPWRHPSGGYAAFSVANATFFAASRPLFRRPCRLFVLPAATDRRLAATFFLLFVKYKK